MRSSICSLCVGSRFTIGVWWLAASLLLARQSQAEQVIHVAPGGIDTSDGSESQPIQSLPQAQRLARELRKKHPGEQITIELAAGDYTLAEPLILTPEDSGPSKERPLTIAGVGDARISGGSRIEGFQLRDGHWVAPVPESLPSFRDLWVNGRRAIRARSPNDGYYRIEAAGPDKRTSFIAEPNNLPAIANAKTAEVAYFHDWSISRVGINSIDAPTRTYHLAAPIGASSQFFAICGFEPHPRYFVENAMELLDAPGEWFLDQAKHELHYMPREDESLDHLEVIVPRLQQLAVLRGDDNKPVENISIRGLRLSYSAFDLPALGYAEVQANWYARRQEPADATLLSPSAAVSIDRAQNCHFENCRFEHLAGVGLHVARMFMWSVQPSATLAAPAS